MKTAHGSQLARRVGAVLATASMMAAGAAIAASPASAADEPGACPAARDLPVRNNWYARDKVSIRGTWVKEVQIVGYGYNKRRLVSYETSMGNYRQYETWDETDNLGPKRIRCTRYDTGEKPDVEITIENVPAPGGGGGRGVNRGGGMVLMTTPGGMEEPVRYGKVGEIQQM